MRWLWRLFTLLVFLGLVRTLFVQQPKTFITWPEGQNWTQKVQGEMKRWQKFTQDIPASIEVEVHRLWDDYRPNGYGKEV